MRIRLLGDVKPLVDGIERLCAERRDVLISEMDTSGYDLLLLAGYSRIIGPDERAEARLGGLCFHPSVLPLHRGPDAVYWTLTNSDPATGATWFWINDQPDTGPIAAQAVIPVPPGVTRGQLYYEYIVPLGMSLLPAILAALDAGFVSAFDQDETSATYEGQRPRD